MEINWRRGFNDGIPYLQATATQDTLQIEAWYTPDVPVPAGPHLWGGLPGLILSLSVNSDQLVVTAENVNLDSDPEFSPPSGKVYTEEKFGKLAKKKSRRALSR